MGPGRFAARWFCDKYNIASVFWYGIYFIITRLFINLFVGVIVGHYLQRVTSHVALGAELVYQRGPRVPGGEIAVLSLASKITGKTD